MHVTLAPARPLANDWVGRAPRTMTTLLLCKLVVEPAGDVPCRIRNISTSGLMVETPLALEADAAIEVELRVGRRLSGKIAWAREGRAGVSLGTEIDPATVLAESGRGAASVDGIARSPRFDVDCPIQVNRRGTPIQARLMNLSQGGAAFEIDTALRRGEQVMLSIPGLGAIPATVRWSSGPRAGVSFDTGVPFNPFGAWMLRQRPVA